MVINAGKVKSPDGIVVDYDPERDVLRVVTKHTDRSEGMSVTNGVELDFDAVSNKPSGATIIGFHRNNWDDKLRELSKILQGHTAIDPDIFVKAIIETVARR
jgi:hypothetical protein